MNPLNYQQPDPTWMKLQRQYTEQPVAIPVPQVYTMPQQGTAAGTFFASAATVGSALFLLFGKGSKKENELAMQVFTIAAPVSLGALFQLQ